MPRRKEKSWRIIQLSLSIDHVKKLDEMRKELTRTEFLERLIDYLYSMPDLKEILYENAVLKDRIKELKRKIRDLEEKLEKRKISQKILKNIAILRDAFLRRIRQGEDPEKVKQGIRSSQIWQELALIFSPEELERKIFADLPREAQILPLQPQRTKVKAKPAPRTRKIKVDHGILAGIFADLASQAGEKEIFALDELKGIFQSYLGSEEEAMAYLIEARNCGYLTVSLTKDGLKLNWPKISRDLGIKLEEGVRIGRERGEAPG